MTDPKSSRSIKIGEFMAQVHELAKSSGLDVAVFANDGEEASVFSNIKDIEGAGNMLAACIMHLARDVEGAPSSAICFADVFIASMAYTIDMTNDFKTQIKNKLNGN